MVFGLELLHDPLQLIGHLQGAQRAIVVVVELRVCDIR